MSYNINQIRDRLKEKIQSNISKKEIFDELHLKDAEGFAKLSNEQLEERISPKLLGLLSLKQSDWKGNWAGDKKDWSGDKKDWNLENK